MGSLRLRILLSIKLPYTGDAAQYNVIAGLANLEPTLCSEDAEKPDAPAAEAKGGEPPAEEPTTWFLTVTGVRTRFIPTETMVEGGESEHTTPSRGTKDCWRS